MNGTRSDGLRGGLYLVVDPRPGAAVVLPKVEAALRGGVTALQVWNHFAPDQRAEPMVAAIIAIARPLGVPVLVHERPDLLERTAADGIHFDRPGPAPDVLAARVGRHLLYGVTCGNDLDCVRRAAQGGVDYVSFCSIYASPSAGACELVELPTVTAARRLVPLTLVASGGITPDNAAPVLDAGADTIAVISGILGADDPEAAARRYRAVIDIHRTRGVAP